MPTGHNAKAQLNAREACLVWTALSAKGTETYGPNCTFKTSLQDGAQLKPVLRSVVCLGLRKLSCKPSASFLTFATPMELRPVQLAT